MVKFVKRKSEVSSDNQSVDHSTLALAIVPYNETENNIEVEEDHIDINLNTSLLQMLMILLGLICLIQDIGILLILNKLTF
jgi:uncharacterized membrane protein